MGAIGCDWVRLGAVGCDWARWENCDEVGARSRGGRKMRKIAARSGKYEAKRALRWLFLVIF
jgi:hypothetical protein